MANKKKRDRRELDDDEPYFIRGTKTGRYYWTTKNKERKSSILVGYFIVLCAVGLLFGVGYALYNAIVSTESLMNRLILLLLTVSFEGWGISFLVGIIIDIHNNKKELKKRKPNAILCI